MTAADADENFSRLAVISASTDAHVLSVERIHILYQLRNQLGKLYSIAIISEVVIMDNDIAPDLEQGRTREDTIQSETTQLDKSLSPKSTGLSSCE